MNFLIDIEHTLSNAWHRIDKINEISSETFHNSFINDSLNVNVYMYMASLKKRGHFITLLTGKTERFRGDILTWLKDNAVEYDRLIIKPENYKGTTLDFKESYIKYSDKKYFMSFTDVGKECEMFEKYGIITYRVEQLRDNK